MGQVASAGDNAAMESFFSLLQNNVLNRRRWATRDQLRLAIITYPAEFRTTKTFASLLIVARAVEYGAAPGRRC